MPWWCPIRAWLLNITRSPCHRTEVTKRLGSTPHRFAVNENQKLPTGSAWHVLVGAELRDERPAREVTHSPGKTKRLADARKSALAEFERIAAEAAGEIVAKLTGAKVTDKAAQAAVTGALNRA